MSVYVLGAEEGVEREGYILTVASDIEHGSDDGASRGLWARKSGLLSTRIDMRRFLSMNLTMDIALRASWLHS